MTPENIALKLIVALIVKLAELIGRLFDRSKPFSLSDWTAETSEALAVTQSALAQVLQDTQELKQASENNRMKSESENQDRPEGWPPDFPKVMHFIDHNNTYGKPWKLLSQHADYDAAKNHEDREAAMRLVSSILDTPENQAQLATLKKQFPNAIVVPVHGIEANGKNRIPEMLAEYVAEHSGLEADTGIVMSKSAHRTGHDQWFRFASRPKFDGEVKSGRDYILVDDVFAYGGSFSELRRHIEQNGGRVIQTAALSLGGHGDEIAPRPQTVANLVDKYGKDMLDFFCKESRLYDGNFNCCTEPEALALSNAPSLDEARDRILEARQAGRSRVRPEMVRGTEETRKSRPFRR
jgi:hypothetical protein